MKVSKGTRVQPTEPKTFALLSFQEEASEQVSQGIGGGVNTRAG